MVTVLKNILFSLSFSIVFTSFYQETYHPTQENLEARENFQDHKFGMFIHFGVYSELGRAEWVMNNDNIPFEDYKKLADFFNPIDFDAKKYVTLAKEAGMKYITLVTRHHDGFSMWDTEYSDFNIMHTPFGRDLVKELTDEAHRQGIGIFYYYSLLDWGREDYSYWTGRTGQGTGRTEKGNWEDYIQFMKDQLTELLTNYGKIDGIWFDGYWDQSKEEGKPDTYVDWHMREIYDLIHQLQPQTLIANNHHLKAFPGEDFQTFEKDLPGQNESGFSGGQEISDLPLETSATMNDSWGFNLTDNNTKSSRDIIDLLVRAAGSNANLLMNVGPMPNGKIPTEFIDRLKSVGKWLDRYGESIYNTRGGYIMPQEWGAITQKDDKWYVHILKNSPDGVVLEDFPYKKIKKAYTLRDGDKIQFDINKEAKKLTMTGNFSVDEADPDCIIVIEK